MKREEFYRQIFDRYWVGNDSKKTSLSFEDIVYFDLIKNEKRIKASMPIAIGLKITDKCNFRCSHCFVKKHSFKETTLELVKKILEDFGYQKPYRIYLTGGEPFMNSQVLQIINYIKAQNIDISIHTNGSLLLEEYICFLEKNSPKEMIYRLV